MKPMFVILFWWLSPTWAVDRNDIRIIDGQYSRENQFPYAAAFYFLKPDGLHFCSGSLISNKWILTAAHCLEGALEFSIYLGSKNLQQVGSNGLIINSTTFVVHPDYDPDLLTNDIGLISLETTLSFSDNIKPVDLPSQALGVNEETMALGWGATTDDQILASDELSYVSLTTISNAVCRRTYGEFIQGNMVCLTGAENQGMCHGDSGGPLIQTTSENKDIQVGVASFYSGAGCETPHPSGYTKTFEYIEWINNVTRDTSSGVVTKALFPLMIILIVKLVILH